MTSVLKKISESKFSSYFAVLKALGPANENFLSFPTEGYTLALDFKVQSGLFELLDELDKIVLEHGGRLYMAKDARMPESMFKQSYHRLDQFMAVRRQYGADGVFNSLQSKRLGF